MSPRYSKDAKGAVVSFRRSIANGVLKILGNPAVGSTLTLSPVGLEGTSPIQYGVQWVRVDPLTLAEIDIVGANSASYITSYDDYAYRLFTYVTMPEALRFAPPTACW